MGKINKQYKSLLKIKKIMTRTEIEGRVKAFLIDDLEIEEDKIFPESDRKSVV